MGKPHRWVLLVLWLALALYPLVEGFVYYRMPIEERPFTAHHDLFKPSGLIGQGLGVAGSLLIFIGVFSYSLRKRWGALHRFGTLRHWLTFHIFVCTLGPFFILLHTTFKIGNIASIAFWSMTIVVVSGLFGRYIYVRIPKTAEGQFFSEQDIEHRLDELAGQVQAITGLARREIVGLMQTLRQPPPRGFFDALWGAVRFDLGQGRLRRQTQQVLAGHNVPMLQIHDAAPLLLTSARLGQERQSAAPFQRLFGYWHVLHLPLALVMLITFVVHVGVAIAFGYTWIF